jgi:DNA-binding MarR family transcriptional regulator
MSIPSLSVHDCLFFASGAMSRALTRLAEDAYAATGVSPSHGYLVMVVAETPGIALGRLAIAMALDASTITRIIEKLEAKGLVRRSAVGRRRTLALTPDGQALLPRLRAAKAEIERRVHAALGEDHARVITKLTLATGEKLSASST